MIIGTKKNRKRVSRLTGPSDISYLNKFKIYKIT